MSRVLQTPIIVQITPFDPVNEQVIEFTYEDIQPVKNRAIITESTSGVVIYDETQETMKLQHTIPSKTLSSGMQYLIQIQVFDADNNESDLSDLSLFYCLTNPTFNFLNVENGMKYESPNIQLILNYYQPEGETLRNFQFYQYSFDKNIIDSSNVFYLEDYKKYTFYRLENNKTYYFRATGETNHGMILDTGYIEVNVDYSMDYNDAIFEVENRYCDGYIQIDSNVVIIEYELKNNNWQLEDGALTLWDNSLTYYGISIPEDFILLVEAKKLPIGRFLSTNTRKDDGYSGDGFILSIVKIAGSYYCQLQIKDINSTYNDGCYFVGLPQSNIITDDGVPILEDINEKILSTENESYDFIDFDDYIVFEVKRINGNYGLDVYYKTDRLN